MVNLWVRFERIPGSTKALTNPYLLIGVKIIEPDFHESPSRTLLALCRTRVKGSALPPEIPHVPQRNFSIAVAPLHTLTSPGRRRMAQDITDTLRRAIKWRSNVMRDSCHNPDFLAKSAGGVRRVRDRATL